MRRVRAAALMASIGVGLLVGVASPAQAATVPTGRMAVSYQFGMYYSQWACQYFGNSLVQGGAFSSYSCVYQYYQPDNAYYWFLFVY
jgi:hypothetical protein